MSSVASITDGKVVNNTSTTETVNKSTSNSSLDKDAFLQLLVAQMKYQDPMQPTSNTEYVAQYATFSQVEQLQNMSSTVNSSSAMQLVGKYVTMDVTTASGASSTVAGRVDYVEKSGNKTLLYIDGTPYNYENLNTVWDEDYLSAYDLCSSWSTSVTSLPSADKITVDYAESVQKLRDTYDSMSAYQKSFVGSSLVSKLEAIEKKIAELKAAASSSSTSDSSESSDSSTDEGADA